MTTTDQSYTEFADDLDLDNLSSAKVEVMRLVDMAYIRRNGRTMYSAAWEPLSYKQEFSREAYPFREDDFDHDNLSAVTKDGRPMGAGTLFGKVRAGFEELGFKINSNENIKAQGVVGNIFKTQKIVEEWGDPDPETGRRRRSFAIVPLELANDYILPSNPEVKRYGFKETYTPVAVTPTQVRLIKEVCLGYKPEDFGAAIMNSGLAEINTDPFLAEAAGDGSSLLSRLQQYGGTLDSTGVLVFEG